MQTYAQWWDLCCGTTLPPQSVWQGFPTCSPWAHATCQTILFNLLKNQNRIGPVSNCWIYRLKWQKSPNCDIFIPFFNDSSFLLLHCGSDSCLATYLWPIRRLNWQYVAHGWFKLESHSVWYDTPSKFGVFFFNPFSHSFTEKCQTTNKLNAVILQWA